MGLKNFPKIIFLVILWTVWDTDIVSGFYHVVPSQWNGGTYDFIVVGGGTAGCVVAARLAESGKHSVLLIEAGDVPPPPTEIPAFSGRYANDPTYTRVIYTVPQRDAGLTRNGRVKYRYGFMLSGTAGLNDHFINRGSPHDFNHWAELTGDTSWNYENMLQYFIRYENYTGLYPSDQHGFGGPISTSNPQYAPAIREWLNAGSELGYAVADSNGPQVISFSRVDFALRFGRRSNSYLGYIRPLIQLGLNKNDSTEAANLLIRVNSFANQIIFEGNRAVGVKFTVTNKTDNSTQVLYARANKEVILSCGAIGSPELLQKSGIGPKSLLQKAKIPLVKDLAVGNNLQDHVAVFQTLILTDNPNPKDSLVSNPERDLTAENLILFNQTGDGPFSNFAGTGGQAFITSSVISRREELLGWADIQLFMTHFVNPLPEGYGNHVLEGDELRKGEVRVRWPILVARPKSRGTVTINPQNVEGLPLIDFQFFSHPHDLKVMVDGLKFAATLCEKTASFQKVGCRLPRYPLRECTHEVFRSDKYWECYTKQLSQSGTHASGTCKMGRKDDNEAVIDAELRVHDFPNLRVVDYSITPTITNGNPVGAVYAFAEKSAEMILKKWEKRTGNVNSILGFGSSEPVLCASCHNYT